MRLGVDAWGLSGSLAHTGMGQYALHLLAGIPEHAPDIDLIAYGGPGEPRPATLPASIRWETPGARGPRKLQALTSRLFALRRAAQRDRLDLFHTPGVHVRPSLPPVASVDCPLVVTVHDLIPLTFYGSAMPLRLRIFYRWNLRRALAAQRVITVSEAARTEIAPRAPGAKITVIPNGVDRPSLTAGPRPAAAGGCGHYILYAGSYEPRKNLMRALDAYVLLAARGDAPDLVAIVDANSGHERAARRYLAQAGVGERVRLVSGVSDEDLWKLYAGADVLFFPSLAEGFGLPPLQAAACGVPVVASDLPAVRETMRDAALFVPARDATAMAAALETALRDETLRARLIAAGYERAGAHTWNRSAEQHVALYREIAGQRS